jgi:hypothetical protein
MVFQPQQSNIRVWFDEPVEQAVSIPSEIILDYDGMCRLIAGEILGLSRALNATPQTRGCAEYFADEDLLHFRLDPDLRGVDSDDVEGKLLVHDSCVVGVEVPVSPIVLAATKQLFRDHWLE